MSPPISMGSDGYYHPSSEAELAALVKWAHDTNRQVRVRGSAHTFPHRAIFTDRDPGEIRIELNIMLDRYRAVRWVDEQQGIVEVEAGCNLSINPYDPTGTSTVKNGLLYQLQQKEWALSDLGGISHQTVSGFLSTGSSGGSLKFGIDENILKLRLIDGTGQIHEVSRKEDPDLFHAAGVSMGLLGVISSVTFQCIPTYNIEGSESTTTTQGCEIDLFGPGTGEKPSLEQFLRETDYSRLMWWPQRGLDRMVVWKARRVPASHDFVPKPYEEMGRFPEGSEVLAGLLLSIIGNLDDLRLLPQKIEPIFSQLDTSLLEDIEKMGFHPKVADALSKIITALLEAGVDGLLELPGIEIMGHTLKHALPSIVPVLYKEFVPLDSEKQPPGPQEFQDYWWTGLPMDNQMDDILMPTWFTEIWIPVSKAQAVMTTLRDFFAAGGLKATGTFSFELYGTKASPFWMSAASDGDPVVRVDVFWFGYNAGDPAVDFYPQFWELLKPFGFKLHWGKFLPNDPPPEKVWARYLAKQFKHWDDFMTLRARLDPKNIFLTAYWREHLGLEDAMPKRPIPAPLPKPDPFATQAWASAERAVTLYSWLILLAVVYGLLAAHIPFLIGHPWTTCKPYTDPVGCAITFHFWEVPIVLYQIAFALYGLRGLKTHAARYASLVTFTAALLAVFALFEVLLILDSFQRGAPAWEIAALFSVATMLMAGVALGLYTRLKLASALSPKR